MLPVSRPALARKYRPSAAIRLPEKMPCRSSIGVCRVGLVFQRPKTLLLRAMAKTSIAMREALLQRTKTIKKNMSAMLT
ncbi:hypothetical protein D3C86_1996830 [compost metagenome]